MAKENEKCCKTENNGPFVGIGSSLAGIFMIIAALFFIFAKDQIVYLVAIAWAFVMLGVFLGLFAFLAIKTKNIKK
jgi:uncharacterized membrane protein YczE